MDRIRTSSRPLMRAVCCASALAWAVWAGPAAAADNDHDGGLMPIAATDHSTHAGMNHASMDHTSMDHSGMNQADGMNGASDDPHAHHRQMMQRQSYAVSAHDYRAPSLELTDAQGRDTSLSGLLDTPQPVMLNFIFTTCTTICPVLTATFSQIQEELGERAAQVRMISVTIDPEQDTPEVLQRYAEQFGAGPQWHFLTGNIDSIIEVEKAFDIYRGSKTNHEPITLLRAPGSNTWVRIEGIASASDVLNEYEKLLEKTP